MNEDKIRTYDELNVDEKEILDVFRQMKLSSDYNKFRFYNLKVEALIEKYEQLNTSVKKSKAITFHSMMN